MLSQNLQAKTTSWLRPEKLAVRITTVIAMIAATYTVMFSWFNWFYQEPAVKYNNVPFPVVETNIHRGDALQFHVDRCSAADYYVVMSRRLTDSVVWELPDQKEVFIPKGCHQIVRVFVDIPTNIPLGEYKLQGEITVVARWFFFSKMRQVPYETETFSIVK